VGRPELADAGADAERESELELEAEEAESEEELAAEDVDGERPTRGELASSGTAVAEPAGRPHNRLINFIQGSWRELQRVQWPDRRQVIQATGVVIGFVIIAGLFLGVADFLAGKVVNYVLTGHFK
jgi:preprotein translocase SecE subunit